MYDIPIMRIGRPYESVEKTELVHHADAAPVARVSQANSGLIARDVSRMDSAVLERFSIRELIGICREAAERFVNDALPCGTRAQTFEQYLDALSATTGMPITCCRDNARKIHTVMREIEAVLAGLTRGVDLSILDRGYGVVDGRTLSFFREGRVFGAVLPSNSPGVHSLWIPAIVLKTPVVLKPGREEPWTPLRVIEAFAAAGLPRAAFGFYPTNHAGASELLRVVDRAMLFGDERTTRPYADDPRVELHGPGFSKIVLGEDAADEWEKHVDLIATSIAANGGRSCINASAVWTPKNGRKLAEALAKRLARIEALAANDPRAEVAAFANPAVAEYLNGAIEQGLSEPGAVDLTRAERGSPRLVRKGRIAYLLPTIMLCETREHPLANREFLFPYASVLECPASEIPGAIGPSLIVTAITKDECLIRALMASPNVDRLNVGPIPTVQISWDQPHEGNLFEHLYRRRAFQTEPAA